MAKVSAVIFLIVHIILTILDLKCLGGPEAKGQFFKKIASLRDPILFIAAVWVIFFFLQTFGIYLMPSLDGMRANLMKIANLPPSRSSAEVSSLEVLYLGALYYGTFLVVSFWDYLSHRFILHHQWGWGLHEYHHLPKKVFNGMPGVSVRPFAAFASLLTYMGTYLTLYPLLKWVLSPRLTTLFIEYVPVEILLITLVLSLGHSLYLRQFPLTHKILSSLLITSPQEHLFHHSRTRHCNYGNFSSVWDHLFGTYLAPQGLDMEKEPLGLSYDQDFLGTITFGFFKLSPQVRAKYGVAASCVLKEEASLKENFDLSKEVQDVS